MRLVHAEHLAAGYRAGEPVLTGVEFAADEGQTVAVLAPNGGGKTTLFRTLLGELAPMGGTFTVAGPVAAVPQHDGARLDFPVTALDVALMGAYGRTPWWRRIARADRDAALAALGRVGLEDVAAREFGALSGGQRRRVMVARAIVQDARVLLLDEPFAGVDRTSEERMLAVIDELAAEGRALLIATHDVEQSRRWDRVLCLNGRQIAFGTPEQTLTAPTLEATYGPELIVLREGARGLTIEHHEH